MRCRFSSQLTLNQTPIERVKIPSKSRDELPPILLALQWIFTTPKVNEQIFSLLEKKILADKKDTGRPGMDLWQILVLGTIRLGLNCDYDRLEHIANYDSLVRQIMGVSAQLQEDESKHFHAKTICQNVNHVDADLLQQINEIVAQEGLSLVTKKDEKLNVKTDTFVVETNIHFPTDMNLLWDAKCKCIELCVLLCAVLGIGSWRKHKDWKKRLKSLMRKVSKISASGGKNKAARLTEAVKAYLQASKELQAKVAESIQELEQTGLDLVQTLRLMELKQFHEDQIKHIDLIIRRLLEDETIPHEEKLFSLFEPHSDFIIKGKQRPPIELGHKLQITTQQHSLIIDYQLADCIKESDTLKPLVERLHSRFGQDSLASLSADKGFSEKETIKELEEMLEDVSISKRGRRNEAERAKENTKRFKQLKNAHSAVESDINCLEHHGLDRCPDKGLHGYKRYIGFGVLSYNLHKIGNHLLAQLRPSQKPRKKAA